MRELTPFRQDCPQIKTLEGRERAAAGVSSGSGVHGSVSARARAATEARRGVSGAEFERIFDPGVLGITVFDTITVEV